MTGPVQLIPEAWKNEVIRILRRGDRASIEWTVQAQSDWQQFGLPYEAYEQLVVCLQDPNALGRQVFGMSGAAEIWEFLFPHPLKIPTPLYGKIGLRNDNKSLVVKIFSTHIDRKGELEKAIQKFLKNRK
ncbi:hypothetical protein [Verrucomicrobium sp. BvORR034]|uniref:hypothetical protein n=1 Tax=Verrucomicrobium sp. BvORR034 TaxID=1396418 RepID=UPI000678D083|nr:hypothetical protein [Verrucomicrobium sp. BvORR034]